MNLAETRRHIQDLLAPKAWIYWVDFLASVAVFYASFYAVEVLPDFSALQILAFALSCFAGYRAVLFTHELTHQKRENLPGFGVAWNLLCGIPMLFPSFMYRGVHNEHHKSPTYGTAEDGEYLPLGAESPWKIVAYLAQTPLIPIAITFRWLVLAPLSFLHPRFRRFVMERCSAMAIDFVPKRHIPRGRDLWDWHWQEILAFVYTATIAYLLATGRLPWHALINFYLLMVVVALINSLRTLAAHRYRNKEGEMSFEAQLLDSVNIEGGTLTELWAPVGLRYHGLHHFFPTMPYHNLGIAHRRLMKALPEDSPYRLTVEPSLFSALSTLWNDASHASSSKPLEPAETP